MNRLFSLFYYTVLLLTLCFAASAQEPKREEGFLELNGTTVFYKTVGTGEPLLVIHGGPGFGHDYMYPWFDELARKNMLVFYDQRSAGLTTNQVNPKSMRVDSFLLDIDLIRKHFKTDKIRMIAHGFGGFLALQYAMKYPSKVKSLALLGSYPVSYDQYIDASLELRKRNNRQDDEDLRVLKKTGGYMNNNAHAIEKVIIITLRHAVANPAVLRQVSFNLKETFYASNLLYGEMAVDLNSYELNDKLKLIKAPVLVIYGDYDPYFQSGAGETFKTNISGSSLVVLKSTGHLPFVEAHDQTIKLLEDFFKPKK